MKKKPKIYYAGYRDGKLYEYFGQPLLNKSKSVIKRDFSCRDVRPVRIIEVKK